MAASLVCRIGDHFACSGVLSTGEACDCYCRCWDSRQAREAREARAARKERLASDEVEGLDI